MEIESFFRDLPELKMEFFRPRTSNHTEIMSILKDHYFNANTIMEEVCIDNYFKPMQRERGEQGVHRSGVGLCRTPAIFAALVRFQG